MKTYNLISQNSEDTKKIAKSLASQLKKGDIVILTGELGSGKTKFAEGFLSFFGLDSEISSPTFNIVNEYSTNNTKIFHFDVYRLEDIDEFYAIGGDEYFSSGICIIEWGNIIKDALPNDYIQISFNKDLEDDNIRFLKIETFGSNYDNLVFNY